LRLNSRRLNYRGLNNNRRLNCGWFHLLSDVIMGAVLMGVYVVGVLLVGVVMGFFYNHRTDIDRLGSLQN
jgi:hypothetical protein